MKREWNPGDVALVTWDDGDGARTEVRLLVERRAPQRGSGMQWWGARGYVEHGCEDDVRPLVVIDPGDRAQVERAFRSLLAPPKPDEPQGLGAVVEDESGRRWVRNPVSDDDDMPWWSAGLKGFHSYAGVKAVRILSEGVQP